MFQPKIPHRYSANVNTHLLEFDSSNNSSIIHGQFQIPVESLTSSVHKGNSNLTPSKKRKDTHGQSLVDKQTSLVENLKAAIETKPLSKIAASFQSFRNNSVKSQNDQLIKIQDIIQQSQKKDSSTHGSSNLNSQRDQINNNNKQNKNEKIITTSRDSKNRVVGMNSNHYSRSGEGSANKIINNQNIQSFNKLIKEQQQQSQQPGGSIFSNQNIINNNNNYNNINNSNNISFNNNNKLNSNNNTNNNNTYQASHHNYNRNTNMDYQHNSSFYSLKNVQYQNYKYVKLPPRLSHLSQSNTITKSRKVSNKVSHSIQDNPIHQGAADDKLATTINNIKEQSSKDQEEVEHDLPVIIEWKNRMLQNTLDMHSQKKNPFQIKDRTKNNLSKLDISVQKMNEDNRIKVSRKAQSMKWLPPIDKYKQNEIYFNDTKGGKRNQEDEGEIYINVLHFNQAFTGKGKKLRCYFESHERANSHGPKNQAEIAKILHKKYHINLVLKELNKSHQGSFFQKDSTVNNNINNQTGDNFLSLDVLPPKQRQTTQTSQVQNQQHILPYNSQIQIERTNKNNPNEFSSINTQPDLTRFESKTLKIKGISAQIIQGSTAEKNGFYQQ